MHLDQPDGLEPVGFRHPLASLDLVARLDPLLEPGELFGVVLGLLGALSLIHDGAPDV